MALKRTKERPRSSRSKKARRPKMTLRWGRILMAFSVISLCSTGVWFVALREPAAPEAHSTTATTVQTATPQPGGNKTLPGDIFVDKAPPTAPADPLLAKAVQERDAALNAARAGNATQGAQPATDVTGQPTAARQAQPTASNLYAGKDLRVVTAELATHKFIGNSPEAWGEHIPGTTNMLSHVWETRQHPAAGNYTLTPQKTAGPVPQSKGTLALTLDACGGPKGSGYDAELIDFLREQHIPATLFLTSSWIRKNPLTARQLAADPLFEVAAHGTDHKPASINGRSIYGIKGTANLAALVKEVEGNARDIEAATGKRPRWYRSGTAYYDDIAAAVIRQLGFGIAGYSIAGDEGATLNASQVEAKVLGAQDGDILLLHMNRPQSGTREGLMQALPKLREKGMAFTRLSQ